MDKTYTDIATISRYYEKSHTIVIGISKYKESSVPNAYNDALAIKRILQESYGFVIGNRIIDSV